MLQIASSHDDVFTLLRKGERERVMKDFEIASRNMLMFIHLERS